MKASPDLIKGAVQLPERSLRERDGSNYLGFCLSYLRDLRVADSRRKDRGEPIAGPRWVTFGTAIGISKDLDEWLDAHRVDSSVELEGGDHRDD